MYNVWTDSKIVEGVERIASMFEPKRMPTNREVIEAEGDYRLANAIQKNGGYEYWAHRLNLKQKHSDTQVGIKGERFVAERLSSMGFDVKLTSVKHPYDLLVNGCVKIDVKTATTTYVRGYPIHSYRLAKTMHTCDFYIFYEMDIGNIYVVPAHRLNGQVQVGMGLQSKVYDEYLGAFDLIKQASEMYQRM